MSEIFLQIHTSIKRCDLIGVAVEHQRIRAGREKACTYTALRRLTPARMRYLRIHVSVKTGSTTLSAVPVISNVGGAAAVTCVTGCESTGVFG